MLKEGSFVIIEKCIGVKVLFFQPAFLTLTSKVKYRLNRAMSEDNEGKKKASHKQTFLGNLPTVPLGLMLSYYPHFFQQQKIAVLLKLQAMDLWLAI